MMVETILESSQDFGMSNGALPQWKRELLQRRAARARPPLAPAPPAPPAPPPPPADDDEELRYGPGIVKRLKSRYLSLALREAPRRRPSVLRRAASLEHLLDERPPPAPRPHARPARPVSMAPTYAPNSAQPPRRESVKRARSVDALSRLDSRDESPHIPLQSSLQPPPQPPPPPPSPPPPAPRAARPPRRPAPLLRDAERPPADLVRSTLRKFETAPPRRTAPAARVSAVLRGLEALPRSSTPEPRGRSPSPAATDLSAIDDQDADAAPASPLESRQVSKQALEGIARAGSSVLYSFAAGGAGSHLPPLAACNPVLLGRARASAAPRRVGVIRPMPPPAPAPAPSKDEVDDKLEEVHVAVSPPPFENETQTKKEQPPSAPIEPRPRTPTEECVSIPIETASDSDSSLDRRASPQPHLHEKSPPPTPHNETPKILPPKPTINGHATPTKPLEAKVKGTISRIGAAGIERAWTGAEDRSPILKEKDINEVKNASSPWGAARAPRPPAPAATSVVFNFSNRKEVPDYVENDGTVRRPSRRNRFKAGEAGVVVLRPEALEAASESDDERPSSPPSPCSVRFVNDNVLINGRSSIASRPPNLSRTLKLKLQFDDSLTRTFEYPSETSLVEEAPAPPAAPAALAANTHIVSVSLCGYTPSKTCADAFPLGLAPRPAEAERAEGLPNGSAGAGEGSAGGDARPCGADSARAWSEARTATDLLF